MGSRQTKLERDASTSTLQTSQSEHISPDGKTVTRSSSAVQQQTETNDQGGTTWTARRTSSSSTVSQSQSSSLGQPTAHDLITMNAGTFVIDGVDISTCTDDFKLNELLDNCNEYEGRRQIRARIKSLLSGNGNASTAKNGPNTISNQSGRTFGSSVTTKSGVITRRTSVQTSRNQSAFSKFQQLDQSVKPTPSPQVKEGQVFQLGVVRSASGVKDVLLKWCQARTREYQVGSIIYLLISASSSFSSSFLCLLNLIVY